MRQIDNQFQLERMQESIVALTLQRETQERVIHDLTIESKLSNKREKDQELQEQEVSKILKARKEDEERLLSEKRKLEDWLADQKKLLELRSEELASKEQKLRESHFQVDQRSRALEKKQTLQSLQDFKRAGTIVSQQEEPDAKNAINCTTSQPPPIIKEAKWFDSTWDVAKFISTMFGVFIFYLYFIHE